MKVSNFFKAKHKCSPPPLEMYQPGMTYKCPSEACKNTFKYIEITEVVEDELSMHAPSIRRERVTKGWELVE